MSSLPERERRILTACHFELWGSIGAGEASRRRCATLGERSDSRELLEFLGILEASARTCRSRSIGGRLGALDPALGLHCRYSLDEILAALGASTLEKPYRIREGMLFRQSRRIRPLLCYARKDRASDYSPTTLYRDYAISPELFHWESQSTTSQASPTGQRLIHHAREGDPSSLRAGARRSVGRFLHVPRAGRARFARRESPIAIMWRLDVRCRRISSAMRRWRQGRRQEQDYGQDGEPVGFGITAAFGEVMPPRGTRW